MKEEKGRVHRPHSSRSLAVCEKSDPRSRDSDARREHADPGDHGKNQIRKSENRYPRVAAGHVEHCSARHGKQLGCGKSGGGTKGREIPRDERVAFDDRPMHRHANI